MADQPRNSPPSRASQRRASVTQRRQILSLLLIVASLLVVLSIVFYSAEDEPVLDQLSLLDIFRIPFDDPVRALAGSLQNHLGLLGAIVSDFFINATIGYASILFPLLAGMWGWIFLRGKEVNKPLVISNYSLIFGLLVSTAFGVTNLTFGQINKEWNGLIGALLSDVLTSLLGGIGSIIIVLTGLFVTIILAIDLDLHKSIDRVSLFWQDVRGKLGGGPSPDGEDGLSGDEADDEGGEEDDFPATAKQFEVTVRKEPRPPKDDRFVPPPVSEDEDDLSGEGEGPRIPGKTPLPIARKTTPVEVEPAGDIPRVGAENEQEEIDYVFPSVELLDAPHHIEMVDDAELKANAELVRAKLANFGIEIESVSVTPGPVITLYELVPASGVKISRIVSLADDLALALAAKGIRIIAPIPGKSAVGVEIPNKNASIVHLRSVINTNKFRESKGLSIAIGKTIAGEVFTDDLAKMPHLLVAGSTGSGKSVGINTFLASILFRLHPSDVKFIIIDPKKIELTPYKKLKHHFLAVSPDINEEIITTPENAVAVLKSVELEMEKRYDRLAAAGVRNIQDYNERLKDGRLKDTDKFTHRKMPYLVLVIDELADLMITAAREVEEPIARLAQLARAVGIHLILATQRPSVDVITGVIKANFPARIAYQVSSKTDSRTILDMNGAEQLLGSGDMLYLPSGSPKPTRIQNAYISSEEVERLTDHIERQEGYAKPFQLPSLLEKKHANAHGASGERDEFFEEAARLIVRHQQGSVSLIQRRLKVGYSRAARIVDELEAAGVVGPFDGSKARLVLIESEEQLDRLLEAQG